MLVVVLRPQHVVMHRHVNAMFFLTALILKADAILVDHPADFPVLFTISGYFTTYSF